jgi:cytoskeletal protein CcmA (bactofilin family)
MSSEDTYSPLSDSDSKPSVPLAGYLNDISSEVNPNESVDDGQMSVIGPTLVIIGDLEAGENLLVQGRIEGTITHNAESLVIGERGTVRASIKARNVIIEGTVEGDIHVSESVSIRETANVKGNIFTPRISITEGAHFKGSIDMDERPDNATTH